MDSFLLFQTFVVFKSSINYMLKQAYYKPEKHQVQSLKMTL